MSHRSSLVPTTDDRKRLPFGPAGIGPGSFDKRIEGALEETCGDRKVIKVDRRVGESILFYEKLTWKREECRGS